MNSINSHIGHSGTLQAYVDAFTNAINLFYWVKHSSSHKLASLTSNPYTALEVCYFSSIFFFVSCVYYCRQKRRSEIIYIYHWLVYIMLYILYHKFLVSFIINIYSIFYKKSLPNIFPLRQVLT